MTKQVKNLWDKIPKWIQRLVEIWAGVTLFATVFAGCATKLHVWELWADTTHVATAESVRVIRHSDSLQWFELDSMDQDIRSLQKGSDNTKFAIALLLADPVEKQRINAALARQQMTGIKVDPDSLLQHILYK